MPENDSDTKVLETVEAAEAPSGETLIKTFLIGDDDPRGSQQMTYDPFAIQYEKNVAIKPPYDPTTWALMLERNTRLRSCVDVMARNTVGLGWDIVPVEDFKEDDTAGKIAFEAERARISKLFMDPNDELPFTETAYLAGIDEYSTGNGYLELVRNAAGEPVGIWHIPSHTMRKRAPDGVGFVQIRGQQVRYFKEFNDPSVINVLTGLKADETLPLEMRATEVLHFKRYSPRSSFYGIPTFVSASMAITGNYLAAQRNVTFFDNDACPRIIVTVSGGKLTPESMAELHRFFQKRLKGVTNAHRAAVIQAEAKNIIGQENNVKIEVHPLTVGVKDDASFDSYRNANNEEVREAFRIAKIILGTTDDVNRASAAVSWESTIEQVLMPDIISKEYRINHTIMKAMGAEKSWFEFTRPTPNNPTELADVLLKFSQMGAMTVNEIRARAPGGEPLEPLDNPLADVPLELLKIQVALGQVPSDMAASLARGLLEASSRIEKRYAAK
jgi:PBSX family phage portal protein